MTLTTVIISYNTRELTLACLRTLFEQTGAGTTDVVVLDNASQDGSAEAVAREFPNVKLIASGENLGFARANNEVIKSVYTEYVLLLNPDTEVQGRAIERLLEFAKANPQYGIFGGRTVFRDGSLNIASCWGQMTPWSLFTRAVGLSSLFKKSELFNPEAYGAWRRDSVREVDIVVGCFMLMKRSLWNELGGFDLSYWMYGEEADLCLRARKLGHRSIICPEAQIMHIVGASFGQRADKSVLVSKAKATLVRRHWSPSIVWWGLLMLWLWAFLRRALTATLVLILPGRFAKSAAFWKEVWSRRADWLGGYSAAAPAQSKSATSPSPAAA